jgi:outer membrane protein assembly factor BamB
MMLASAVHANDWPQWRGPNFNGSVEATNLPTDWGTSKNVVWRAELPGTAAATPVICGDRVFISGIDSAREVLQAMCFDRTSGKLLWQHDVPGAVSRDYRSNFASGSPATDGNIVVFFYGNGPLVCFDMDGKKKWERNVQDDYGEFAFLWTFSSSPLLYQGKLYVQVLQRDVAVDGRGFVGKKNESYLLAIDPETGKTLWRHVRPSKAVFESRESFTTPIPHRFEGRDELLVIGGDAVTGHDPQTGNELWRWGTWNPMRIPHWRHVPSPVAGAGIILVCAPKRDPLYAIKAGGTGILDDNWIAWVSRDQPEISADVPTPAFYDGDFFVLSDVRRALSRVEPATGEVKWSIATPGRTKYEASPLAADGKLYIINFDGLVTVVDAADGEILNSISMDDPRGDDKVRASIVTAHGQLFIRTTRHLYCIAEQP